MGEDKAVNKELGDSLVRAATTASSLEAEQDNGNITKTRSKAPPNESSFLGTTSGGGPRCQETMGDTIAQTRFENVSKLSNDSLLARDVEITLVSVQDNVDKEMFDVDALNGEEVFVAGHNENVVEEVVDAAQVSTVATTVTITIEEITLAQALEALKTSQQSHDKIEFDEEERFAREKAEKEKEVNIALIETWDDTQVKINANHQLAEKMQAQEQEELSIKEKATLFQQLLEKRRKHFAAKRAEEKRNKPPTKAQQRKIIAFKKVNTFEDFRTELVEGKEKREGTELIQGIIKKQKVEEDKETAKLKQLMKIIPDEEEVAIYAIPLAVKSPSIVGWKIHKEGRKSYYQIMRADGKSQIGRLGFNLGDLKTMFEPHVEDKVLRNQQDYKVLDWKLYDSCGVHSLRMQHMQIYILVEKKYPLAPLTLSMMLEKKLMIDYESEMAYQLLKFIMKHINLLFML
ncbi:hypothetical protein Tco_0893410 [Tanacetum coccineum]|uniref:Uncharacterized protein n=1 Tax=Tanacetum coccineum TaxID=301880 RepID=A0ABQ5CBU6_9ASTR